MSAPLPACHALCLSLLFLTAAPLVFLAMLPSVSQLKIQPLPIIGSPAGRRWLRLILFYLPPLRSGYQSGSLVWCAFAPGNAWLWVFFFFLVFKGLSFLSSLPGLLLPHMPSTALMLRAALSATHASTRSRLAPSAKCPQTTSLRLRLLQPFGLWFRCYRRSVKKKGKQVKFQSTIQQGYINGSVPSPPLLLCGLTLP